MCIQSTASTIFAALLDQCSPLGQLEPPFDFLEPPPDCFEPLTDPTATLANLRQTFTDEQLLHCGILRLSPQGQPRLAPVLARQGDPIVAVRSAPNAPPSALLVGRCCLPVDHGPTTQALLDSSRTGTTSMPLFAVADTRELVLYRALGVPSTLAGGLRHPSLSALQQLADAHKAPAPRLVFVASSLRQMSGRMPPPIRFALRHLALARERLHFALIMWGWQLDDDQITHWKYLLRLRDRSTIVAWLTDQQQPFRDFEDVVAPPVVQEVERPNYLQARRERLQDSLTGPDGLPLQDSRSQYAIALNEAVVEPLIERALRVADPVQRLLQLEIAERIGMLAEFRLSISAVLRHGTLPDASIKLYLNTTGLVARSLRDRKCS
jgi:hypothetical protein